MRDNKDQSSFVSSHLLQNFTKDAYQSQYSFPTQPYHSSSKIQPAKHNNNHSTSMLIPTLVSQTSRKKLKTSKNEFYDHFQQIQKILMSENYNLKQQNEYLASQVRRISKKQKHTRQQLQEITYRSNQQENYIFKLQNEFCQLKDFIQQNIQTLIVLLQTNCLNDLKNTITDFIEGISDLLSLDLVEKTNQKQFEKIEQNKSADQQILKEIEELSVRLQSLIKQNNSSCREPAVRRECIEIARQIKQLQNRKKTPRFSKEQSQTYLQKQKKSISKNGTINSSLRQKTSRLSLKQQTIVKKQQSEDNFKCPKQLFSKVTHRRSGSRQTRLKHVNSISSMLNRGEQR